MRSLLASAALCLAAAVTGCQTVYHGQLDAGEYHAGVKLRRVALLPFDNATTDPAAGRAIREFTASALAEHGIRFRQTEESLIIAARKNIATESGLYPDLARLTQARYFLTGTVHEYRYMSDLEGSPALGFSLRLIDARDGRTLWCGTAANTGYGWQSLSELCADSVRQIIRDIPLVMIDETQPARVCLRTGKPALYTPVGKDDLYEVDTLDGSLAYTVAIREGALPPAYVAPQAIALPIPQPHQQPAAAAADSAGSRQPARQGALSVEPGVKSTTPVAEPPATPDPVPAPAPAPAPAAEPAERPIR